jgi:hypothetical protein
LTERALLAASVAPLLAPEIKSTRIIGSVGDTIGIW